MRAVYWSSLAEFFGKRRQRAKEAGFDHHLTKPVDPAILERLPAGLTQTTP